MGRGGGEGGDDLHVSISRNCLEHPTAAGFSGACLLGKGTPL